MYCRSKRKYWYLHGKRISHSGQNTAISFGMWSLRAGQSVGLLVTRDGDLHLFVDGKHRKIVWSGLPTDQPLWGLANVFGNCAKIKTDLLCGKC